MTQKFAIKEDNYYSHCGTDGTINIESPYSETNTPCCFHYFYNSSWVLDCVKARASRVEEIRKQRDEALFNRFDGIMLGYERDNNTSMITDCESLRQSLKDAPVNATTALSSLTDYDDIQAVTLQSVLTVPTSLQDLVNEYFNNL